MCHQEPWLLSLFTAKCEITSRRSACARPMRCAQRRNVMSVQTAPGVIPNIEWDDGAVIVFSFKGSDGSTVMSGFPHVVPAWQSQTGEQTQVSKTVQTIQQVALQVSADPATWVETLKQAARNDKGPGVTVVYDDSFVHYTTQIGSSSDLHVLYSLAG